MYFSPDSGILKGFQDQAVLFWNNFFCFDLCVHGGEKTIAGIWEGGRELNPSSFAGCTTSVAWMVWGEGLEVTRGTVISIVLLFLRAGNLPVPRRPCWLLCPCSINPEFSKIRAVIMVLSIWEAKSQIAPDLCMQRAAKWWLLCLDPQRY